jgi:hypothetical protein
MRGGVPIRADGTRGQKKESENILSGIFPTLAIKDLKIKNQLVRQPIDFWIVRTIHI